MQYRALGTVCALVIGVYAYASHSGWMESLTPNAADTYYNLLVQGFRGGHLSLNEDAPPGLTRLADPYDPTANGLYRSASYGLHDLSYYKGRLYLYFGVTPVLILFWPFVAVTGQYLFHREAVAVFCTIGFLASVVLLHSLWRRYFAEVRFEVVAACAVALGLASGVPMLLSRGEVYEVAISCGYMLTMLALGAIWGALHEPERRWKWLAAASVTYGLAVAARPSLLFGAVILLVPVAQAWRGRRPMGVLLMAATIPITFIGLGLMLYNAQRFDSPFEFGQHYQLSACRIPERFFSLRYLWFNFRVYFLEPANWSARFPFVNEITPPPSPPGHLGVERGFGILPNIPLACFAMAVPFVWRRWSSEADKSLRWFITAVALLVGICALTLGVFCAAYLRYEMDFLPALMLLAVVGILGLERALADQPVRRQAVRWGWCILGGFSVAFNLLQCFLQLANTHNTLGIALREVGRAPEAIIEYEQAVRIKPDYVEAQYNLGLTLLEGGRAPEALEHFQQAIRIKPDFADAHLNLGVALEQLGRNADAIPQFEQALRIRPDFAVAQNNLGNALLQSGRIPEAIEHLTQALRIKPDYVEAHYNLGNALYQMGRVPEAIGHYQEALRIRPDYAKAHCNLGLALGQTGRLREAIDQYEQALRINPGYAEAHYNLGNALLRTGKLQDAIGHFEQALRLVPKYAQAHNSLGLALSGTGRVQDAIGHYEQALRIKPDFAEAHSNLGVVLERVGKLQDAVGHYEEAVRIKPDYAPAQNSLAWILATNDDDRLRNPAKAVQLAERACDLTARRDPNFLDTLAAAYAANGRFADAIRTAEQAANLALAAGQKDLAGQIQHRLELYKAGRPYYEKPVASEPAK